MMGFFEQFFVWATLSLINLVASIIIYQTTKLENKEKLEFEYELSTRSISKDAISLPRSFIYLSIFTGVLNTGGALLRFQQICLLEIPSIPWLALFSHNTEGPKELMDLFNAEIIVAVSDWSNFSMGLSFLLAGLCNFATARQLRLREQWVKRVLLPAPVSRPNWYQVIGDMKGGGVPRGPVMEGEDESFDENQEREG